MSSAHRIGKDKKNGKIKKKVVKNSYVVTRSDWPTCLRTGQSDASSTIGLGKFVSTRFLMQ